MMNERKNPTGGRKQKNENDLIDEEYQIKPEALNTRALTIINRVNNKLTGILIIIDSLTFFIRARFRKHNS